MLNTVEQSWGRGLRTSGCLHISETHGVIFFTLYTHLGGVDVPLIGYVLWTIVYPHVHVSLDQNSFIYFNIADISQTVPDC